ncbi:MAG: DEAD/DEAH box helicase, partial [archaeon]|nr:DEAD/DEAH box helicase [archaeon]
MWTTFCDKLKIEKEISSIINDVFKFEKITKVQFISILEFIKNEDVIVKSATGSGKTLAYIIPMLQRMINYIKSNENEESEGKVPNKIFSLILLPSHELSIQVFLTLKKFLENLKEYSFTAHLYIGGKKIENDLKRIEESLPNIIVATPGRLMDILERKKDLNFADLQLLILDEADRMLDMGFESAVSSILAKLPKQRRTGLFSATVTANIENIIKAGMRNPIYVEVHHQMKKNEDIFISNNVLNYLDNILSQSKGKSVYNNLNFCKVIPFDFEDSKISNSIQEVPKTLNQFYIQIENIKYKIPILIQILIGLYNSEGNKKIIIFFGSCA